MLLASSLRNGATKAAAAEAKSPAPASTLARRVFKPHSARKSVHAAECVAVRQSTSGRLRNSSH
eukprot:13673843-Alexandrium_andersonii.AAC.1